MIQVYKESNTDYEHNGDCILMPTECKVYATLNEAWYAELYHPIDPEGRWNYLTAEAVVKLPSFNGDQLFRIKYREKNLDEVYCKLEPIFFDAGGDCWLFKVPVSAKNGQQALELMAAANNKYSVESDITDTASAYYEWKTLLEAISGDDENTFLKRWGGEIIYDNFKIIINEEAGSDNGLEIRYGKNLIGIEEAVDMNDLITRIWPLTYAGHPTKYGYITSPLEGNYPIVRQKVITFDNIRYKDDITDEAKEIEEGRIVVHNQNEIDMALYDAVRAEFRAGIDKPVITLNVDMILVGNTEQYAALKGLESVSLGDTVHVFSENIGITTVMRVFELAYDCIRERCDKIKLGSEGYNYFKNSSKDIRITKSALLDAQVQIGDVTELANDTDITLAEVVDVEDEVVTVKGNKLKGSTWYGTTNGIVFGEPPTRSGTFRMVTEDGKVKFQYSADSGATWSDIGYLQRYVESGDNVLGLVSAPDGNARIWVEDVDKYVWLSAPTGYINLYASGGEINILADDIELDRGNQVFHPFWVEQVPTDNNAANYGWQYVSPPQGSNCHYLIQAACYGASSSYYVKGVINYANSDQWILLFNTQYSNGYTTCIWI